MRREIRVTPRAAADISAIADYTREKWGAVAMSSYVRGLEEKSQWLAESPGLGKPRDEIHPGYRSLPFKRHIIFYLVVEDTVQIIGVPHQAMDIPAYFLDLSQR